MSQPTPLPGVAKSFIVGNLPDKSLVYSNHVFVHPSETALFPKGPTATHFVQINDGMTFVVRAHADIKTGEVGFNALQRECAKLSAGGSCTLKPWTPPEHSVLMTCRVQLEMINAKVKAEVREDDLVAMIKERFKGQPLSKGQIFAADFQGKAVKMIVLTLEVPNIVESKASDGDKGSISKYANCGMLSDSTQITVIPTESRYLTFEKSASASSASPLLRPDWKFEDMGIGGLDAEFSAIFRRAFASRLFPPQVIGQLGIHHVKGMLLYGPPGTGKTLIARQIGKMLAGKEPKVVNGPEILNKYVGASEENIRKLFEEAEKEYKEKKDNSGLHIIIFDEIDAICKARGTDRGGTGVHDTVVNQMLSKIDGVEALNNILVIGMTNRKDMIDPALLRPGRLEVHVEIGLPDEKGRRQIFNIHTRKMRENNLLAGDVDLDKLAKLSKNFSGAEIEGLVKSAASYALYGNIDVTKDVVSGKTDLKNIKITMEHFLYALSEVTPAFGVAEDDLKNALRGELVEWGQDISKVIQTGKLLVRQVQTSANTPLLSVLVQGRPGTGKTAVAAKIALESGFPFVKLVSPEQFVDVSERGKCSEITKVFEDAYKSPLSLIILDDVERLLEYVPIGPRFSNAVLQTLLVLLKRVPPHENRRLMVIATTSSPGILEEMQMQQSFNVVLQVPEITKPQQVKAVFTGMNVGVDAKELDRLAEECVFPISTKQLTVLIEMARQDGQAITASRFKDCIVAAGLDKKKGGKDDLL